MTRLLRRTLVHGVPALASLAIIGAVQAAPTPTDISQTPLIVTNAALVKPNIMLLMDNSGSMGRTHMPDEVESVTGVKSIGYKSAQCNALYYNPSGIYLLPKKYDGALFPTPTFNNAPYAGYGAFFATPDTSTTDLRSQFVPYDWGKDTVLGPVAAPSSGPSAGFVAATPGAAYYYVYTGPETLKYDAAPCKQLDTGATVTTPGGGLWTRVDVSLRPAAEQAHFALWYSFYRTRLGLTKSAASLAFAPLDVSKRVGFITVEPKVNNTDAAIDQNRYLAIADFSTVANGQKDLWYRKLFSQKASGASPTREGLARVGRYYGGETDGINSGMGGPDPVQYACQQNFTILTTDGYWNGQTESPGGGGVKLNRDGAGLVGQQDGNPTCSVSDPYCVRPMFDGNSADILKITDKNNAYTNVTCPIDTIYRRVEQQQRKDYIITRDTTRTQQETIQFRQSSSQLVAKSEQTVKTVKQNKATVDQYWVDTTNENKERYQIWKSENKIVRDTEQFQLQTRQQTAQTLRNTETVTQTRARVEQWQTSSVQYVMATTQFSTSTTNYRQSKTQTYKRQWQYIGTSSNGETSAPLPSASCPVGYTCAQYDSFSQALVDPATCPMSTVSNYDPDPTKSYVHTDCTPGPQNSPDAAVAACSIPPNTTDPATSGNSWVKTVCTATSTMPSYQPGYTVATCLPSSQSSTPPYTVTNCTVVQNTQVPQTASCTPAAPVTGPGPSYITTQCLRPTGTNYAATNSAPCNESAGPQTDPITKVTTTCTKPTDSDNPAPPAGAGCTTTTGTVAPYTKTTCYVNPMSTTAKSISSCNAVTPTGNPWIKTVCSQTAVAPTPVATGVQWGTCSSGANAGAYAYDTVCSTSNSNNATNFVPSATCGGTTSSTPATAAPWIDSFCTKPAGPNNIIGAAWNPANGTCPNDTGLAPPYARSTCTPTVVSVATPVDRTTCTATSTSTTSPFVTTSCVRQDLATTFTCPGSTPTGFPWIYEGCGYGVSSAKVAYGSCTPGSSAGLLPNQVCRQEVNTNPVANCTPDPTPAGTNPKVTCTGSLVVSALTGPADPATCPATNGPQGGTDQYDVSCVKSPHGTYATPAGVQSCPAPAMDPVTFDVITCYNPPATNFSNVNSAPCTVSVTNGNSGNGWTTTQCSKSDLFVDMQGSVCAATAHGQSGTGSEVKCVPNGGAVAQPIAVASCAGLVGTSDPFPPYDTVTACNSTQGTAPWVNFGGSVCNSVTGSVDCRLLPTGSDVPDSTCQISNGPDATGLVTTCPHITGTGYKYKVSTTTTITTTPMSGGTPSGPTLTLAVPGSPTTPTDVDGVCYASQQAIPSLAFPAKPSVSVAGCTAWPCSETIPTAGGSLNSLADVAQYYYVTDLRLTLDNKVPPAGTTLEDDTAPHQHMTTFTVALGVNGTLNYRGDYKSATTGDFADIRIGNKNWPVWPDPNLNYSNVDNYNNPKSIDDFWHTAVNGRGRYFNANDPTTVIQGLADALAKVGTLTASGAADAISSLTPVAGNNFVFGTSYESGSWSGDLEAFTIDPVTGVLSASHAWSAKSLLDTRTFPTCDNRKIYLIRGGNSLVDFAWNTDECPSTGIPSGTLTSTPLTAAEMANFSPSNIALLSQFTAYLPTDPQLLAAQAPGVLLNYLRGQRGREDYVANSTTRLFRKRTSVLGDLVDSQPVYVRQPFANYADAGYDTFKTNQAGRTPMVYVGGNDGMLHAFYATFESTDPTYASRGQEAWSVIPTEVLPNLYKLADTNYERGNHQFFVDGTPVASDVYDGSAWHTILVGGLNAGGKGYYALDITNPASPSALWEFRQNGSVCPATSAAAVNNTSDCNMGLSFGKPVISKIGSTWVVMFTSGYNNINGAAQGDGQGFLYVVNAMTGAIIHKIATGVGSSSAPAGLAQINNYVDNVLINNSTLRAYGGDLLGNVWRFEFAPTPRAVLVGTATTTASVPQPITTRPELAELNGEPFVLVGTGKLLGITDVSDPQQQSVYGIHDKITATPTGTPPTIYSSLRGALRKMTMTQVGTGASAVRTIACTSDCAKTDGWVVNLAETGERVNVDMKLVLGTLVFPSNVPEGVPCSVGGHSWLNQLDFRTGQAVSTAPLSGSTGIISNYLADSLNQGINVVQLQPPAGSNNPTYQTEAHQGDSTRRMQATYVAPPLFVGKRISWREVVQ